MKFLDDYKNHGGRVTLGSDAGYIWKLYGFGYVREMELLQEAGFHPLEVLRAATIHGAQVLRHGRPDRVDPAGQAGRPGRDRATIHCTISRFCTVPGTSGWTTANRPARVGGVRYTIKDGIVYDARELLADVREIVDQARAEAGPGPHPERLPYRPD